MDGKRPNDTDNLEVSLDASVEECLLLVQENTELKQFNEALHAMLQTLLDAWHRGDLDGTIEKIAAELEALSKRKVN